VDRLRGWGQLVWALPWLLFQVFPISDIVTVDRPAPARALAVAGLVAFTLAYLRVVRDLGAPRRVRPEYLVMVALAVALAVGFGSSWAGLMIYVPNVDTVFANALKAGGTEVRPVVDQFYGDRSGTLKDPFGHVWTVSTHVEDVAPDEMTKRMEKWTKEQAGSTA